MQPRYTAAPMFSPRFPPFARNVLATAVRATLVGMLLAAGSGAVHAQAAGGITAAQERRQYTIPAGPLGQALTGFAGSAGVAIQLDPQLVEGRSSRGLSGSYTVREGFAQLLAGANLDAVERTTGTYVLRAAPAADAPPPAPGTTQTLPLVQVTANADPTALPPPYAGGQVARGGKLGMLGNKDFLDTPFNITSITSEAMQNQQARSIGDVVKNDPSVRTIWPDVSYINQLTIRGLPTQTQDFAINGLYGIVPPQMTGALEFAERVEILKGPTALVNGMAPSGAVGGNVNIVAKRATDAPITQATASYYSDSQFGIHTDIGRRFGTDNAWGIRFNGAYRDGETGIADQKQRVGSTVVGIDYRGDRVRFSGDFGYHDMRSTNPARIVYTDNANFQIPAAPKSTQSLGQSWYFAQSTDSFGMVQGEVDLHPDLTAYAAYGARQNEFLGLYNFIYLQNAQGDFRANQYYQPTYSNTESSTAGLRGRLTTGGIRHEVNLSYSRLFTESGVLAPVISTYNSNIYNPATISQPSLAAYRGSAPKTAEAELESTALADTLHMFDDRVQFTLGLREQSVRVRNFNATTGAQTTYYDRRKLTPAAALVVRPTRQLSFYGNYIEGLSQGPTAPAGTTNVGQMFEPISSKQYEVGAKYDFGRFATTVSAFQIIVPSGYTNASNTYVVDAEQRNRGVELNVFGEPAAGVRTLGGVTFMQGILTKTGTPAYDGNHAIGVPKVQFNLGGEWDTPFFPSFTLTGRLIYTSSQYYNISNSQSIPAWTRVDIGARYKTRVTGRNVVLRAGIENLFNRDYWAAASSSFGLARSVPRSFLLSATMDF